ncbi:hypothetical protein AGOR_G00031110 [Albula goreensis]|uniref:SEA domain-containing protein n=1 Tax=Albula goreensis TaxID=1534307 RepID=A0A8T3E823_9TELE|nr:hypothetical protein AGOR_G00031110 [Albula goreensis]
MSNEYIALRKITVGTAANDSSHTDAEPAEDQQTATDGNHLAKDSTEEIHLLSADQVTVSIKTPNSSARSSVSSHGSATPAGDRLQEGQTSPAVQSKTRKVLSDLNAVVVWRLRLWMVITLIFALIIFVIVLSLILCSVLYVDEDEKFDRASFTVPRLFKGTLRLVNQNFTAALLSSDSPESLALSENLREQLSKVFSSSPALGRFFNSAGTSSFSNGSVIASYWLKFMLPPDQGELVQYTLSREMVRGILRQQLYDQELHPQDPLYIDPTLVQMEVATQ